MTPEPILAQAPQYYYGWLRHVSDGCLVSFLHPFSLNPKQSDIFMIYIYYIHSYDKITYYIFKMNKLSIVIMTVHGFLSFFFSFGLRLWDFQNIFHNIFTACNPGNYLCTFPLFLTN